MPSNDSSFSPLVILQLLSASVLLGLIFAAPGPWDLQRLGGAILAFVSLCLLGVSRFQLGRSFSVTPQARALVTRGIYSRIRNPIYVFSGSMIAGIIHAAPVTPPLDARGKKDGLNVIYNLKELNLPFILFR